MYKKYGDEWEKEVMKNPKKIIVQMLRRVAIERDRLEAVEQSVQSDGLKPCAECGALGYSHRPSCSKYGSYVVSTRR